MSGASSCKDAVSRFKLILSDDVADVLITPRSPAAKATVIRTFGHTCRSLLRQNRPAVFGTIDVARTKIAQQRMTAEYLQWPYSSR